MREDKTERMRERNNRKNERERKMFYGGDLNKKGM